ncbi:hypothetical protein NDK43_26090 [Neobacillus pocheonensis]|uniref:Uncharacterized protein n=1 Tax=Neobacillus pocheonensis TaxID=363869 RepID=A0ABT0WFU5_9BACI|nr:hypothetical protein [Neobacillus pocheonensis]
MVQPHSKFGCCRNWILHFFDPASDDETENVQNAALIETVAIDLDYSSILML